MTDNLVRFLAVVFFVTCSAVLFAAFRARTIILPVATGPHRQPWHTFTPADGLTYWIGLAAWIIGWLFWTTLLVNSSVRAIKAR